MTEAHGDFVWYELLTTDVASAEAFYCHVMGWSGREASTKTVSYRVLASPQGPVCGLMALPPAAKASGATARWAGYIGVDDLDATVGRLQAAGGRVFVPPTETNIGKISIVADPQNATLALVQALSVDLNPSDGPDDERRIGRVGWHELLAIDCVKAFAFYSSLLGWQTASDGSGAIDDYQLFTIHGHVRGGIFNKLPRAPFPFWLYYFDVEDLGAAMARVTAQGGRVVQGPVALPDGVSIARCIDPQGGMFALQGKTFSKETSGTEAAIATPLDLAWSAEWGGFASRGRIVSKPKAASTAKTSSPKKSSPPKR